MASHGYDDEFDIVYADGWNQYDSHARRRAPQQASIHMTQQMTMKEAPAYDGRTSFFAFDDAIHDWCDITELEPEKCGLALRHKLQGEASQYKRLRRCEVYISTDSCDPISSRGSPSSVLVSMHAVHEIQQRYNGLAYVNVPWTDARTGSIEATQHRQKYTTEVGFSFRICKSGRFDARSEEHTHKYHDTCASATLIQKTSKN